MFVNKPMFRIGLVKMHEDNAIKKKGNVNVGKTVSGWMLMFRL